MSYNNEYAARLEAAGHVLKCDEDGDIDYWVLVYGYHNGPGCVNCNDRWCEHCEDSFKSCIGRAVYDAACKDSRCKQYETLKK